MTVIYYIKKANKTTGSEVIFLNNQINDPNSRLLEQLLWTLAEYKREKEEQSKDNRFLK